MKFKICPGRSWDTRKAIYHVNQLNLNVVCDVMWLGNIEIYWYVDKWPNKDEWYTQVCFFFKYIVVQGLQIFTKHHQLFLPIMIKVTNLNSLLYKNL